MPKISNKIREKWAFLTRSFFSNFIIFDNATRCTKCVDKFTNMHQIRQKKQIQRLQFWQDWKNLLSKNDQLRRQNFHSKHDQKSWDFSPKFDSKAFTFRPVFLDYNRFLKWNIHFLKLLLINNPIFSGHIQTCITNTEKREPTPVKFAAKVYSYPAQNTILGRVGLHFSIS